VGSTHVDLQKNKLEIGLKYNKEEETRGGEDQGRYKKQAKQQTGMNSDI
jgi:hypothetical protein